MVHFKDYKIKVDTYSPGLKPRSNEADMEKIKKLYSDLENRFDGVEEGLVDCKVEKLVVTIVKRGGIADDDIPEGDPHIKHEERRS